MFHRARISGPCPPLIACVLLAVTSHAQTTASLEDAESIYRTRGPSEALPLFVQLADEFERSGDGASLATAHHFIGASHWRLGDYEQSRTFLESAHSSRVSLGDLEGQGKTLNVLGLLDWYVGDYDAAISSFQKASEIGRSLGDTRLEGATLNNISLVLDERGEYATSLTQYEEVLEIYSRADFPRGVGDTLGNIGGVHLLLGHYTEALDYYERALAISTELDSDVAMSLDHGNIATAYLGLGEIDLALQHYDLAIDLSKAAGVLQDHAYWLGGKADALIQQGQLDEGLKYHRDALDAYEQIGAQARLQQALHDLGNTFLSLGDSSSAEQLFLEALDIAATLGHDHGTTINLVALGHLHLRRARPDKAVDFFEQAHERADSNESAVLAANSLVGLSLALTDLEQYADARLAAVEARDLGHQIGSRYGLAEALLAIADADRLAGNDDLAAENYVAALDALTPAGDPDILWRVHFGHGMALDALGHTDAAIEQLQAAIDVIERVRARLREERFRSGYVQDKDEVYTELVRLQLEADSTEAAFETAERLRARAFADQVERARVVELSPEQQRQQSEYQARVRALQQLLIAEESLPSEEQRQAAMQTFSSELMAAESDYQDFLDDLSSREPDDVDPAQFSPASDIQAQLADDEILLDYVVGATTVTVFGISGDNVDAVSTPITRDELRARVELLRDLIGRGNGNDWEKPASGLSDILLSGVQEAGWLAGKRHIYLVPHDILNYLPFAVLSVDERDRSQLLIDSTTIAYLPTASALWASPRSSSGGKGVLAVAPASSRLKYAPQEARSIEAMFRPRSHLLEGASATESELKALASQFDVLHFATHGYFNLISPMLSGLQLEADHRDDGLLEVHEVMQMKLNAGLVTLSACETGMSGGYFATIPAGDELVGLTRAFLYAGSESVVATLWEVNDMSSVELMTGLYHQLGPTGSHNNVAAALAFAQSEARQDKDRRHPYFWAPYIFVGPRTIEQHEPVQVLEESS